MPEILEAWNLGTSQQIYYEPSTPFVADFVGSMNFLHGIPLAALQRPGAGPGGTPRSVAIRPEAVEVAEGPPGSAPADGFDARVEAMEIRGPF